MSKNTDKYSAAELQKKYASKSGYKVTTNKTMSNASFWLDDDFVEDTKSYTLLDPAARKSADYVRLAGYQRAVSNFVRIVTGRADIPVIYSSGNDSYTDGKKVIISSKLDEKEFDSSVGLALHEGSHIALTDFQVMRDAYYNGQYLDRVYDWHRNSVLGGSPNLSRIQELVNIIEDRRIDRFVYDSAPGYQGYYQALYSKYFNSKEIDMALKMGLKDDGGSWNDYLFHICNFANPNRNLKTLPALKKIWDIIHIPTINRLKSTRDVLEVAIDVYIAISEAVNEFATVAAKPQPKPKTQPRKEEEVQDEMNENLDSPQSEPQASNDESEDESESEESESMGTDGEESENDEDSTEGTTGNEGDDTGGSAEEEEGPTKEEKDAVLEKIKHKLEKAIQEQKEFLEGKTPKKKLSKTDAAKVNAAAQSGAEYEAVGGDVVLADGKTYKMGTTKCLVVKGLSDSLLTSNILGYQASDVPNQLRRIERGYAVNYIAEGITLGTLLGKKLKTRDEERSLKTTRLEAGRIDKRLIAELGFGNDRVFAQTMFNTTRPAYVHISVDASGSMDGKEWQAAMKTAVAIAKAGTMISSMEVVISARGTVNDAPLMWIVYNSKTDKLAALKDKLLAPQAAGSTPEGLCFEAIQKEIARDARGKDAYFINLSDGCPSYVDKSISYNGEVAVIHTRDQVNKMRANNINVLSYYICEREDKYSLEVFKKMYGKDSATIDVHSLTQLAKSLNELFERKNA
jgi:hypothetical protein